MVSLFLPLVQRDLRLTFSQAGSLGAAVLATYALMQIPAGLITDRFGAKRILVAGLLGTNALAVAFGLFAVYPLLVVVQALSGIFRALAFAPGLLLMRSLFPPDRQATALGLASTGQFLSIVLLNSVGLLLIERLGWQLVFVVLGAAGFVSLAAYWVVSGPGPARTDASALSLRDVSAVFARRAVWLIGGIQFVRLAVATGFGFWLPSLIIVEKGYPLSVAGMIVAFSALVTAPGGVMGGYLTDRLRKPLLVIATCLAVLAVMMIALIQVRDPLLFVLLVGVYSLFRQAYFGSVFALPIRLLGDASPGRMTGVANLFANAGAFTATFAIGAAHDLTGSFAAGMDLVAALCVMGIGLTVLLANDTRRLSLESA